MTDGDTPPSRVRADNGYETGLTPEVQKRIVERIRSGCWWIAEAVMAEGFDKKTHYRWLQNGSKGIEPYATYRREVEKAKRELSANIKAGIYTIGLNGEDEKNRLRALEWMASKVDPENCGQKLELVTSGSETRKAWEDLTDEELEAELRKALASGGENG